MTSTPLVINESMCPKYLETQELPTVQLKVTNLRFEGPGLTGPSAE